MVEESELIESLRLSRDGAFPSDSETLGPLKQIAYIYGANRIGKTTISRVIEDSESRWLAEHCGVRASIGGVSNMERRMSDALKKPYEAALTSAQSSPVLNVDETPWRLGEQLHWLWTGARAP